MNTTEAKTGTTYIWREDNRDSRDLAGEFGSRIDTGQPSRWQHGGWGIFPGKISVKVIRKYEENAETLRRTRTNAVRLTINIQRAVLAPLDIAAEKVEFFKDWPEIEHKVVVANSMARSWLAGHPWHSHTPYSVPAMDDDFNEKCGAWRDAPDRLRLWHTPNLSKTFEFEDFRGRDHSDNEMLLGLARQIMNEWIDAGCIGLEMEGHNTYRYLFPAAFGSKTPNIGPVQKFSFLCHEHFERPENCQTNKSI